ncbi:hormone-sensitive lipase isoform X2 [Macrotis lagotis]|uniref:hormone-sensitive lipase isoform X2 n=1 Tax=Macrotis lagotis TaxID=92651 RepID=UPI003D684269
MEAGLSVPPLTTEEQGSASEQGPTSQKGPAFKQGPGLQQETSLEQEPVTKNEPEQGSESEQTPIAQLGPAPEQTPLTQLGLHAPEQTLLIQLGPHAPEQTPLTQLGPCTPEQIPLASLGQHNPDQTPLTQLGPHAPEKTPLTQLGPHAPEMTPLTQLGPHAPEETPLTQLGPHAPEKAPLTQLEPCAPEKAPLSRLGPAPEQKLTFQLGSLSHQESASERDSSPPSQQGYTFRQKSMMHLNLKSLEDSATDMGFQQDSDSENEFTTQLRAGAEVKVSQPEAASESKLPVQPRPESRQEHIIQLESPRYLGSKTKQESSFEQGLASRQASPFVAWPQEVTLEQQQATVELEAGSEKRLFMSQSSPGQSLVTEKESETPDSTAKEDPPSQQNYIPHKAVSAIEGTLDSDGKMHINQDGVPKDTASRLTHNMDLRAMTQSLVAISEDNATYFASQGPGETARRLSGTFTGIREQALGLEPALGQLLGVAHLFDLDPETPANGYRSLVHTARCCLAHLLHKARYVATNRKSIFFRAGHNLAELEAYLAALTQLRALAYYAQRLLATNRPGGLFFEGDGGLSADFLKEYGTLHKGCFYGRCLGFQFTPAIRPFLQTISIGLVSFGEHYKRNESGIGVAASSLFTGGRFAIDPELRGAEFERITQNLDVHFWKAFWNVTEIEVLSSLANMVSATVRVCRVLSLPPQPFEIPLASNPQVNVTISPPVAHTGPGPVLVRLISYDLREGQDSEELNLLARSEGPRTLDLRPRTHHAPRSKSLVIHIHGGGFVAQTSKSHEPYLKSWAQELGVPILSIDYSLAPEAPFPRALEECFYAYCWALKNCRLLGSTGERVCLAGDSAGGNLCFTVSLRAAAYGVRMPDGIMAAYPATLLQASASPSRLMSLMDPLLPLSVLSKCLSAYAGVEPEVQEDQEQQALGVMGLVKRDTAGLLRDLRLGASSWLNTFLELGGRRLTEGSPSATETMRRSVSEAALQESSGFPKDSPKSLTLQDLNLVRSSTSPGLSSSEETLSSVPQEVTFFLPSLGSSEDEVMAEEEEEEDSQEKSQDDLGFTFPEGFQPRRSSQGRATLTLQTSPIVKNPFMSPLLAQDSMLQSLPPIHIVACALDPMLDDSVMFARRLRTLGRPVSLRVVEDLPHGFLSLASLCRETRQATALCVERIRLILNGSEMQTSPTPTKPQWSEWTRTKHPPQTPASAMRSPPSLRPAPPSCLSGLGPAHS